MLSRPSSSKVIITEEQQKYVTQEKANYLAMTVSQEMLEEDISDVLLERYH